MPPKKVAKKNGSKKVPFRVKMDGAQEVILTGDFTGWATDRLKLDPAGPGEWKGFLELPPGSYQYRLIVDGQWRDHAEESRRVPNPYGSENCILTVG
jgi:1,4-alpha-glucan branching enzyme